MSNKELEKQLHLIIKTAKQALNMLGAEETTSGREVRPTAKTVIDIPETEFDYSMQPRAFFKKHAKGLSGAKIFVLMVAYFTNQKNTDAAFLGDIQKEWSKMKGVIKNEFNSTYPVRAKEADWISSPKNSFYSLRPSWKNILK